MSVLDRFASKIPERLRNLRPGSSQDGTGLNINLQSFKSMRSAKEFFPVERISRPVDMNDATRRISHNTRYYAGNYAIIIAILCVYALFTNPLLLLALIFVVGGFISINKLGPEPNQLGNQTVTQKHLYTGLFVIGIPLLWLAAPLSTLFWIVGSSAIFVFSHASFIEPGVEAEYGAVDDGADQV